MKTWEKVNVPEDVGLSSKGLLQYLEQVEQQGVEMHSIKVLRRGKVAMTANFAPFDDQTPHMLFSLSKSFCSAAAGFAVQEGLLRWDSKVLEVLSEYAPENPSEWLQSVTLHHLLCMGSGLKEESDNVAGHPEIKEWAKNILSFDCDREPGTHFHYNSHGTYLVSCIVQKLTGQTVRDYLIPRLFVPLGIAVPFWSSSPEKVNCGGWGLNLTCDHIARFGQCLLQKGMWEGKQVLPLEWIEKATVFQIDNSNGQKDPNNEWHQGYGYQFWRTRGNRYRGDGAFGQICMISEEKDMVVAVTAGVDDMGKEMQLLHEYLFPAADMAPGTEADQRALQQKLASLSCKWPQDDGTGREWDGFYKSREAAFVQEEAAFYARENNGVLHLRLMDGALELEMLFGRNQLVLFPVNPGIYGDQAHVWQGKYGWQEGKVHLLARCLNGPVKLDMEIAFPEEGKIEVDASRSLCFLQYKGVMEKQ